MLISPDLSNLANPGVKLESTQKSFGLYFPCYEVETYADLEW